MSIRAMEIVWQHSKLEGSARNLMLAIAWYADEQNLEGWPRIATLARKVFVSDRQIQRLIAQCHAAGELEIQFRRGQSNIYRITLRGDTHVTPPTTRGDMGGDIQGAKGVTSMSPDPIRIRHYLKEEGTVSQKPNPEAEPEQLELKPARRCTHGRCTGRGDCVYVFVEDGPEQMAQAKEIFGVLLRKLQEKSCANDDSGPIAGKQTNAQNVGDQTKESHSTGPMHVPGGARVQAISKLIDAAAWLRQEVADDETSAADRRARRTPEPGRILRTATAGRAPP